MNKNDDGCLILKGCALITLFIAINGQGFADEALGSAIDCSKIDIDYVDRPEMTQQERLEVMNNAFFESVNRFELCNLSAQTSSQSDSTNQQQQSADSGSGQAGEEGNGQEGGQGNEGEMQGAESNEMAMESVASPLMTGTELESAETSFESSDAPSDESQIIEKELDESVAAYTGGKNGALPEDIPDVNNDDAVAAQIKRAAEIEKDPVKKEKLWNEYRKYKGLPVKQ